MEECKHCKATMWYEERIDKAHNAKNPRFSMCCLEGKIKVPPLKSSPTFLRNILDSNGGARARNFRDQIRVYNSMFSFTSAGAKVDRLINKMPGPYVFKISGQNCHRIGTMLPAENSQPKFAQLYISDTANEVQNRMNRVIDTKSKNKIDETIVEGLINMFDEVNPLARTFRMARHRIDKGKDIDFHIKLIANRLRQYSAPTSSEIAALIVGDFDRSKRAEM